MAKPPAVPPFARTRLAKNIPPLRTVSTALNSGVPLALAGNTELASQFDTFARRIIDPSAVDVQSVDKRAVPLGLQRLASIW
jgi:hypothetical protein